MSLQPGRHSEGERERRLLPFPEDSIRWHPSDEAGASHRGVDMFLLFPIRHVPVLLPSRRAFSPLTPSPTLSLLSEPGLLSVACYCGGQRKRAEFGMRYENWDVLLFPEGSRVPVQEFRTQCFVTRDRDSPYLLSSPFLNTSPYYPTHQLVGQLPVLTAFIPSLPQNSAFRVSIHSWEKPRPSRTTESLMQPDDSVLYEVRVFVDGLCVAGSIFGQRIAWPHIIDLSSQLDKNGSQDSLRFPPFHQEILHQSHWDAADLHGRIRVTISEGFSRPHRSPPFERIKDIIAYSFQHAPLHVLEFSNIAWPNANMWFQIPCNIFNHQPGPGYGGYGSYGDFKETDDAHAHSPSRHVVTGAGNWQISNQPFPSNGSYRIFPTSLPPWPSGTGDSRYLSQDPCLPDPFTEQFGRVQGPSLRQRSTLDDVPMPDYVGSSSTSSRVISNMTGISFDHNKQPSITAPPDDPQYTELCELMSPLKTLPSANIVPTTTTSSIPTAISRPSAAARARTESYSKSGTRTTSLREVTRSRNRDISDTSTRSDPAGESIIETITTRRFRASPSDNVKGKKEAKCAGKNSNKEDEPDTTSEASSRDLGKVTGNQPRVIFRTSEKVLHVSGETKRKRSNCKTLNSSQATTDDPVTLSPTKKMPRVDRRESSQNANIGLYVDSHVPSKTGGIFSEIA